MVQLGVVFSILSCACVVCITAGAAAAAAATAPTGPNPFQQWTATDDCSPAAAAAAAATAAAAASAATQSKTTVTNLAADVQQRQYGVMETSEPNGGFLCISAILTCFALSVGYVASLYVWSSPYPRDHSSTIKKRFLSVFIMTLVSPLSLYFGISGHVLQKATIWELLGIRWSGFIQATFTSLFLTMVLFLGPLSMQGLNGLWRLYTEPMYWVGSARTLIWWKNQVVAPLSEEWTFRACMLPLLLQCFTPTSAILICPLFFGVAHFHHVVERTRMGMQFKSALIMSCFQFAYTTLFGAYAAFLFAKTGHFVAPFAAHSFCNHMGFPDLSEVIDCKDPLKRAGLLCLFVIGLVAWCFLLTPLTNPAWFNNNLFWHKHFL